MLNGLWGSFRSNQLVAVIGPSGCGKTTLLQFLAGNNRWQRERLRIGGIAEPKVAFIGQHDGLLAGLTARETLIYASRLQNSAAHFDHGAHVGPILDELGLSSCADRSVSKLSGGQAKRVTIAQELLYPTNLLILDELTSGLDASTSYSIVRLLRQLVSDSAYPMSIVMSIHQPSARLFSVFDRVYVMSEGRCLYEGACDLGQVNEHLGRFQLECPKFHNIADYLIELASCAGPADEPPAGPGQAGAVRDQMAECQRKQAEARLVGLAPGPKRNEADLYGAIERSRRRRPRPFWAHFKIHFKRSLLRIRRSHVLTWLQLLTYVLLGLQLSTFYGPEIGQLSGCPRLPSNLMAYVLAPGVNDDGDGHAAGAPGANDHDHDHDELGLEIRRIQENMNFLLVAVLTATFAALEITVITFPLEAKTVKREWRNGWYRVSSYFMGRTLADLPFQLAFVMAFCLLIYLLTGQLGLGTWRFGSFVLTVVMTALVAQSFGFLFGAIFMDSLPAAVFAAPLAVFPTLLFSGFFSRVSQVPPFYRPLTYLSHFRYAFDALLVTLYGYDRCQCDQEALTRYHAGLANQTDTMRDMFQLLFGRSDCGAGAAADAPAGEAVSADDLAAIGAQNATLAGQLMGMIRAGASQPPAPMSAPLSAGAGFGQLEDLLVEGLFQQMAGGAPNGTLAEGAPNGTLAETAPWDGPGASPMERLAARFSLRLTTMLNKQSNFGHPMPSECAKFNSYLLTEFGLQDEDLGFGLLMLLAAVLITRLICGSILHFAMATRV